MKETVIEIRIPKEDWAVADPITLGLYWKLAEMRVKVTASRRESRRRNIIQLKVQKPLDKV